MSDTALPFAADALPALPGTGAPAPDLLPRLLADAVPVLLAYFEAPQLRCVFANQRFVQALGLPATSILGQTARQLAGPRLWAVIEPNTQKTLAGHTAQYTREHRMPNGELLQLEVSLVPHFAPAGAGQAAPVVQGLFMLGNDVSHHLRAEQAIRASDERMQKFSAATEEGIAFHTDGIITDCNEALLRLTGYPREQVLGRAMLDFIQPADHPRVRHYMEQRLESLYEVGVLHQDGHVLPLEVMGKTMPQVAGGYRVVVVRDTTQRRQAQQRADFLALHDALTQLPNRRHLLQQLGQVLAQADAAGTALLFLDLDHFKTVNESLGNAAGDLLLCEVAQRLRGPDAPFAARVGGDQFAVLLQQLRGRGHAASLADALLQRLRRPCTIASMPISVSPSMGISLFPQDGHSPDDLLRHAATAMQHAKDSGRGTFMFYTPGMEGQPTALLHQEHLLRQAVLQQAFELHYQPQVEVATGRLCGFEALVRWRHPERGLVGPGEFIELAESRGLITPIGRWVLRQACRQARAWHAAGLPRVPMAVNLSAIEFRQRNVVADIAQVLQECDLAAQYLEVEITESVLMHNPEQARATLQELQALGVAVTVDDFGTGYSSLAYLKRYPLNRIKVDRSFVMDTPGDTDDVAIVSAVVQLARSLQLQSVAEGVETPEQLQLLRRLGCDLAQGFGIGRPMPAQQAQAWMQALPASARGG
ncbi:hypothetical protein MASR1M59_21660 [Melaminivora sp.]